MALVHFHIVDQKLGLTDLTLLYFKIVIANLRIRKYVNRQRAFPHKVVQAKEEQRTFQTISQNFNLPKREASITEIKDSTT